MAELLDNQDGWHFVPDHPQQHYFFKNHSLCGKYKEVPEGAHHDNNPLIHCEKCEQTVRKLMAVSSSITGKKLNTKQVFNLLEQLDKIKLNRGLSQKVKHEENTVAVVSSQNGSKTVIDKTGVRTIDENKSNY